MKREEAEASADSRSHSALTHRRVRGPRCSRPPTPAHGAGHGHPDTDTRTWTPGPAATGTPLVATGDMAVARGSVVSQLQGVHAPKGARLPSPRCEPTPGGFLTWDLTHNG